MTLCIAAEFRHGKGKERRTGIVHLSDTRQEKGGVFHELVGSEDATKIAKIGPLEQLFHVMLSGSPSRAIDLMTACRKAVEELIAAPGGADSDLEISQYLQSVRKAAAGKKRLLIDHHLQMTLGISHQEFLDTAKNRFSPDHYHQLWNEIRNIDLGTDLIFTGFHGDPGGSIESLLVRLDRAGEAHWENGYSVIGIGLDIALAFLCQRDYEPTSIDLMDCLFRVVEAKTAAERNRHVGTGTMAVIAIHGLGRFALTPKGWSVVEASAKAGKPAPFTDDLIKVGP